MPLEPISCNVCMDLIPLVKDGIASEDSCALVMNHIAQCTQCAHAFGEQKPEIPAMDDAGVLSKLKKQLTLLQLSVILAGSLIGMVLSNGTSMFYNALIMPLIGGFGYMLFRKKSPFVPLALFLFSFLWVTVREIADGFLTHSAVTDLLIMSAWWSGIYAAFSAVGTLIAALLHYAFKKEV